MRFNRLRICQVTMKTIHKFDPATHRCACGQWERGYKPKKEPVRPRAECQICERQQATQASGCLGHHGYLRPGHGFIEGDCPGVGHQPYPATDALESYLKFLNVRIKSGKDRLAELPGLAEVLYTYGVYRNHKRVTESVVVKKGDKYHYDAERRTTIPEFATVIESETRKVNTQLDQLKAEAKRVTNRIAAAK
jgi:hypothetical protein